MKFFITNYAIKNNKAFTLIEVMISTALLTVIFTAFISFIAIMTKQVSREDKKNILKITAENLFQDISFNYSSYQRHYEKIAATCTSPCKQESEFLTYLKLPFTIRGKKIIPKADCPHCKTRIGYLLYGVGDQSYLTLKIKAYKSPTDSSPIILSGFVGGAQ